MWSIRTVTTSRLSVTRRSDVGRDAAVPSDPRESLCEHCLSSPGTF
jgi:hypothetical protein